MNMLVFLGISALFILMTFMSIMFRKWYLSCVLLILTAGFELGGARMLLV